MPSDKVLNPVRRVRTSFAGMSEESGLRDYSSIRGFAEFVGCSEGAIRKVEKTGELSGRLAQLIEWRTGVSARWLRSSPGPSDPIIAVNGEPWNGANLDIFRLLTALKPMLIACPSMVALAIGSRVQSMLMEIIWDGNGLALLSLLQALQRRGAFTRSDTIDGPRFCRSGGASEWRPFEPQPLLDEALKLLAERNETLPERQLRRLEYLKSVEPAAPEMAKTAKLLEEYKRFRSHSLRVGARLRAAQNRGSGDGDSD